MSTKRDELHIAVRANDSQKVEELLTQGVNINSLFYGWTPLQLSIELGHSKIALLLMDNNCDYSYHYNNNLSPFEMAVTKNQVSVVEKLLSLGVDGCQPLSNGEPSIFLAIEKESVKMVQTLIEGKVEVNCRRKKSGESPLQVACKDGCQKMISALISAGADVNFVCPDTGLSPLITAALSENKEALKILLKNECDINLQDNDGWTALWYAYSNRNEDILWLLLKSGADKSIVNNDQKSVIDEALLTDEEEMIELLQKSIY